MSAASTRNLTILLTDIKGFTEKTSRKSRSEVLEMLDKHKEIVLPVLQRRGGKLIKTIGDAFLMVFDSPTDAVLSGVEVQEALLRHNEDKTGDDRLDVRIAINVGEVSLTDDDVFGEPVNITARIEAIAEAGEVYFSEAVYLAMNKKEVPTSEVGFRKLKGIADEIKVYKVKREVPVEELPPEGAFPPPADKGEAPPPPPPEIKAESRVKLRRRAAALAVDAILCTMISGVFLGSRETPPDYSSKRRIERNINKKISTKGLNLKINGNTVTLGDLEISDRGIKGKNLDISDEGIKIGYAANPLTPEEKIAAAEDDVKHAAGDIEDAAKEVAAAVEEVIDEEVPPPSRRRSEKTFPFIWVIYGTFFLTIWSATPGKRLLKLRVIDAEAPASAPMDWKTAGLRSFVSVFSASFLMIGYFWGAFSKDKRTWHDLIAKTRVVNE